MVDYVLSERSQLQKILDFKVGSFRPWLSDHCPLHYSISLKRDIIEPKQKEKDDKVIDSPARCTWDHSSQAKFEEYLSSETPKFLFKNIMGDPKNRNPAKFAKNVSNGILKCVSESGIKTKKKFKNIKSTKGNAPLFYNDCQKLKSELKQLAKNLKHSPESNSIREKLFTTKNKFKNLIKKRKAFYKYSIIEQMHLNGKSNPKKT